MTTTTPTTPKPRRRWLQFSLRTMMVLLASFSRGCFVCRSRTRLRAGRCSLTWLARMFVCAVILIVCVLVMCCRFFGVYGWRDVMAYRGMAAECDPLWKDLALRRIQQGDSVAKLVAIREPDRLLEYGPYQEFRFHGGYRPGPGDISFTGLSVHAKEGRLLTASAWSCTWTHVFFEDKDETARIEAEFAKYVAAMASELPSTDDGHPP